jgi:formylmethanofuran dehydrogenase subunit E
MTALADMLQASAALHRHLCPRQVLGVRMGMLAGEVLGLSLPQGNKRLLTIVEIDGCAADGVSVATNCWVGRQTMRVEDFGKVAASFVDTAVGRAVRLAPRADVRLKAGAYAPEARTKWQAQLLGYQRMPAAELLTVQAVSLCAPLAELVGRAGQRAVCDRCGEEVLNGREVAGRGMILCRACAGQAYYRRPGALAAHDIQHWPVVRTGAASTLSALD